MNRIWCPVRALARSAGPVLALTLLFGATSAFAAPAVFYTDLIAAPNTGGENNKGAFVSIYGKGFGTVRGNVTIGGGAVDNYRLWTDTKIVVQLGPGVSTGPVVVTDVSGASGTGGTFTVRPGHIYFVSASATGTGSGTATDPWQSPASAYHAVTAGDVVYIHAGTYSKNYDGANWGNPNMAFDASESNTAWVGYPGETATFVAPAGNPNFHMYKGTNSWPTGLVIANLKLIGSTSSIDGGGQYPPVYQQGAPSMRIVGNDISATYTNNTMTGLVTLPGNNDALLGNWLHDSGTSPPINNNHGVYIQNGADNVEVGWNTFTGLKLGFVIQLHGDFAFKYQNAMIHDNVIIATNLDDCRGIGVGTSLPGTYGAIWNNILVNVGQGFAGIDISNGDWKVYNNTLYNIDGKAAGVIAINGTQSTLSTGTATTADIRNNIVVPANTSTGYIPSGQYGLPAGNMTLDSNLYFGGSGSAPSADAHAVSGDPKFLNAAGSDFHLQSGSPAVDAGSSNVTTVVMTDHDGVPRPQGPKFDIGAYELPAANGLPAPQNAQITAH